LRPSTGRTLNSRSARCGHNPRYHGSAGK
jgi:hypothetical protein